MSVNINKKNNLETLDPRVKKVKIAFECTSDQHKSKKSTETLFQEDT